MDPIRPADRPDQQWTFREGDEVFAGDGDKLGKVVAVQPDYLVVKQGFFFPTDYYVPTGAVTNYEDGEIHLGVTKDEALTQGWDAAPAEGHAVAADGELHPPTATAAGGAGGTGAALRHGGEEHPGAAVEHRTVAGDVLHAAEAEVLRVPVHEEELTATTRERELGGVRVEKSVVAEERTLEVPVTEERLRVERRVVDRPAEAGDATAFQESTIEVAIRGEEVEVQKRARVVEEVEVAKEAVQRTERVAGTVRREQVRVEERLDADRGGGYPDATYPDEARDR